jgi:hypothetical protein
MIKMESLLNDTSCEMIRKEIKFKDKMFAKNSYMEGFIPWAPWVPMPYPYKELLFAKEMYYRGESMSVQTPDFVDIANEITNFTSRNSLISAVKKMLFIRGVRTNL